MIYKLKTLFFSSIVTLAVGPGKITYGLQNLHFSSFNLYGEDTKFTLNVITKPSNSVTIDIYVVNDLYPSGVLIYNKIFNESLTDTFYYDNSYTRSSGNEILVKQIINGDEKTYTYAVSVTVKKDVLLNTSPYIYESTGDIYNRNSKNVWTLSKEKIEFVNFDEYYVPDYYHYLDIRNFKINVTNKDGELKLKSGKLVVTNYNGAFNSISNTSTITLPLVLKNDDYGLYHLSFRDPLYVDRNTLEIKTRKAINSVKTYNFYFPCDQKRFEQEYNISIVLDGLGIDFSKFILNLKYKSIDNIFGDCRSSEYCIVNR